jgi:hypothetical protein
MFWCSLLNVSPIMRSSPSCCASITGTCALADAPVAGSVPHFCSESESAGDMLAQSAVPLFSASTTGL